jgi:hypothetical protein
VQKKSEIHVSLSARAKAMAIRCLKNIQTNNLATWNFAIFINSKRVLAQENKDMAGSTTFSVGIDFGRVHLG